MAALHTYITKFPTQIDNLDYLEKLIIKSLALYNQYPVESLNKLNENWKLKQKIIRLKMIDDPLTQGGDGLRYRGKTKAEKEYEQNKTRTIVRRKLNDKKYVNRFLMGFFTIGVAAAAVYVFTTNPKEPAEDIFMKFYHLLSYKNL